jgi:hypothetical protein
MLLVVVVLGFHFFLTYAWNTSATSLRALVGNDFLTAYMTPMFTQGWAVFAPNPGSTNVSLEVRALEPASGDAAAKATPWFSITERDTERFVRYHPAPSRMYLNNYILGDRFHGAFLALNAKTRDLVGNDYFGADWLGRLRDDLSSTSDPWVANYIEYEQTVTGLATAVARARWGEGITGVQVRTVSTVAVPFEQRFDAGVKEQPSYFIEGWRQPLTVSRLDAAPIDSFYGKSAG